MAPHSCSTCHVCGREYTYIRSNDQRQVAVSTCDICSATQSESADNTCTLEQSDENQKIERPQTKTLKKPTPNLSHPVIEDVGDYAEPQPTKKNRDNTKVYKNYTHYRDRKARNKQVSDSNKEKTENSDKRTVPSPCNSCSRNVAPERLHSHVPFVNGTKSLTKPTTERNSNMPRKNGEDANKNEQKNKQTDNAGTVTDTGASKGPRALICYICGRPFGSKSLSLHEPHCLERWKRENELLPPDQRRPLPQKPDTSAAMSRDEFNEASWNSFQANLVPCPNCGRTFFPERLIVHQRVCKETANNRNKSVSSNESMLSMSPINDNDIQLVQKEGSRVAAARIPLGTCYICGKLFGSKSIYIHEPQCLKKWRAENDQLPPHLKRPEPEKPALVLNPDGTMDVNTMIEAAWQSHLQQLVPCPRCDRTFYPDRLLVHERSCKGK